jgi:uncharacterized protein (TIGR00255 family)
MTISMTGFAARKGQGAGASWVWDLRAVNGKGLDLRLRVPDWIDGLELSLRGELQKALSRGNVSLTLRVTRDPSEAETLRLNPVALQAVLAALATVDAAAMQTGVTLSQSTPVDVLGFRGVVETGSAEDDYARLRAAILADLAPLLQDFNQMRAAEGAALAAVISAQIERIASLAAEARLAADARRDAQAGVLQAQLTRILDAVDSIEPARLAQELALLAVKTDVTEELDRLAAHVDAVRALLAEAGPVGRKFDFLMQEFMREANTLCSKSQDIQLTRIGLDLKTVIDQMREQVQNVE